jgi:hypothetical protein
MEKIKCPACAGPDNAKCATCQGTSEVTQEIFDKFIIQKTKQKESEVFWGRVQEYIGQPGKFKFEVNEELFQLDN